MVPNRMNLFLLEYSDTKLRTRSPFAKFPFTSQFSVQSHHFGENILCPHQFKCWSACKHNRFSFREPNSGQRNYLAEKQKKKESFSRPPHAWLYLFRLSATIRSGFVRRRKVNGVIWTVRVVPTVGLRPLDCLCQLCLIAKQKLKTLNFDETF